MDLKTLLFNLEYDRLSSIIWFENNFMKLNHDKCHFLTSGSKHELLWTKVGESKIWESPEEKLLGITIDKNLNFNSHLTILCKKVGAKVTALARMAKLLSFHKRRILFKTFVESQFSYCPLVWMFCSRKMNRRINHIHERALRLVYHDYTTTFEDLLKRDKSVSIHHRNIQHVAIEMFKVKNKLCSSFMNDIFEKAHEPLTRSGCDFTRPNVNLVSMGVNSLRNFGPIVWNDMLPENMGIQVLYNLRK